MGNRGPRPWGLPLRTRLTLVLVLALAASAAQLALFLRANAAFRRAQDETLAWTRHALLVKETESAAVEYVSEVEEVLEHGPEHSAFAEARLRLVRGSRASLEDSLTLSPEEQGDAHRIAWDLEMLLELGDEAAHRREQALLENLHLFFEGGLRPALLRRVANQEAGARRAAAEGDARARSALLLATGAGFVLLLAGLALVLAMTRGTARSLAALVQGARRIQDGDVGAEVVVSSADELGAVARAFNAMSLHLRETTISKTELERLVGERTAALEATSRELAANLRELHQAQAQIAASSRLVAVGALAAGLAHEINNPLSIVVSNTAFALDETRRLAERLGRGEVPAAAEVQEMQEALEEARLGANRVREIVRDLRTFARGEGVQRATADLARVLDSALRMASHEIQQVGRLVREIPELPPVEGSEARLAQVFLNLVVNAGQAMPRRPPSENEIRIAASADEDRVSVEIRDNGVGIPPEDLAHVFEPFHSTRTSAAGSGMGLAICKRILEEGGGSISVESRLGTGTAFRVSLPRAGRPPPPAPPQGHPSAAGLQGAG
jgi:signal transduction histidine kinase